MLSYSENFSFFSFNFKFCLSGDTLRPKSSYVANGLWNSVPIKLECIEGG